jgi:H+/Cl- antiporter ClcA
MPSPSPDLVALLRSRSYVGLLVFAGVLGVPISAAAYGFLALLSGLQEWAFTDLPRAVGFQETPRWWPLPLLTLAGVVVGLTIRSLPGKGGHSPADGLATGGAPTPVELPGVAVAALASIGLGVVLGPEAPLIALGGGLAGWAVRLARRDAPAQATAVVAAAGSFAAISTLLGSPLLGAFLLMEASGLAGPTLGLVLVPGLVAAGVGSLIFIGLDAWTGLGTFSLALPDVPPFARRVAPVTVAAVVGFAVWTVVLVGEGVVSALPAVAAVLAVVAAWLLGRDREGLVRMDWNGLAFVATSLAIAMVVTSIFVGLYPRVMVSTLGSATDLTVSNTTSSPYTLRVMTVTAVVLLPIVLAYQGWTYYVFRRRIGRSDVSGPPSRPSPASR